MLGFLNWRLAVCALASAISIATANAQWWRESFDSYAFGPGPSGMGGWTTWDNNPSAQAILSDYYCSPHKSVCITGTADVVHPFTAFTSGKFIAKASWYVPTTAPAGSTFFILLNKYASGGPYNWSVQVGADRVLGTVTWYSSGALQGTGSTPITAGPGVLPLKTNQWVDIYAEIDLTLNTVSVYYDNTLLATTPWKSNAQSVAAIAAIDLYCDTPAANSYFDNICILRNLPRRYQRGRKDNYNQLWSDFNVQGTNLMTALSTTYPAATFTGFDNLSLNRFFATTFTGLPSGPCAVFKGEVSFAAKPNGGGSDNDSFFLWNPPATSLPPTWLWGDRFDAATSTTWIGTPSTTLIRNLGKLPATASFPTGANALPSINQYGTLSLWGQDDTALDWAELRLWTCRPFWMGLPTVSSGPARIDLLPSGSLNLNVTGTGGGFEVETGEANGVSLTFGQSPIEFPNNGKIDLMLAGTDQNGVRESLLGIRGQRSGNTMNMSLLPGVLVGASYRYSLIGMDGRVLQTGTKGAGEPLPLSVPPGSGGSGAEGLCYVAVNFPPGWHPNQPIDLVYLPCGECFKIYGEDACVVVQHLTIPAAMLGRCFSIGTLTSASDLPTPSFDFVIEQVGTTIGGHGLGGTVLGNAVSEVYNGTHHFSNIGSSGQDGVLVGVGQGTSVNVGTELDDSGLPDGAVLHVEAVGKKGTQTDASLGMINMLKDGSLRTLSANFSAIGSTTVRVQLVNGGTIVHSQAGVSPSNIGSSLDSSPASWTAGTDWDDPLCVQAHWTSPTTFQVNGIPYAVDEVRIFPETGADPHIAYLSGMRLTGENVGEFSISDAQATRSISGVVTLGDLIPPMAGREVEIEVRDAANSEVLETHVVTLGANGAYQFETGATGEAYVAIKSSHWLRRTTRVVLVNTGITGLDAYLTNGDVDRNNEVNVGDYAVLSAAYNSFSGDPNWDPDADLNGDDEVSIGDYAVLSVNFGEFGDD